MKTVLKFATLALLCAPALAAAASEPPPRWTFGLLAIDRNVPYRDLDEDLILAPLVRFEGERFYLRGLRGGVVLHEGGGFELGPFLQVRGDGYDAEDSDFLAGMDDRRFSLDGGFAGSWRGDDFGQIELSVATDLLDRSGGQEAELSYTALFNVGGWTFVPAVAAKWQSQDLVDYYYGVRADEALPGRPQYHPDAALFPELSLLVSRRFGAWTLYARAAHTWLPEEITGSPLVDRSGRTGLMVGFGWSPD